MPKTRTVRDPFLGQDVQVGDRLVDRLRGRYACGPMTSSGEPEFGWRTFETPPIQKNAADRIEQLEAALREAREAINDYGLDDFESTTHETLVKIDAALKEQAHA